MAARLLTLLTIAALAGCGRSGEGADAEVRRRIAAMDLRARIAQLLVVEVPRGQKAEPLAEAAAEGGFGGVWVAGGDARATAALVRRLQSVAAVPLLVGAPLDGGVPLEGAADVPPVRALGFAGPDEPRIAGLLVGGEARALGINLGLVRAPPMNGLEPLSVAARAPDRTSRAIVGFAAGAREAGIAVGIESLWTEASGSPYLTWDRARLEAIELRMLRDILEGGASAVALGPVRLPAITGDSTPVAFSGAAIEGLLRRDHAWTGPVAVDLHPGGPLAGALGGEEAAVRAVLAGADLLLRVRDPEPVVRALAAAVESGRIPIARVDSAAFRVLELKVRALRGPVPAHPDSLAPRLRTPAILDLAARLRRSASGPPPTAPAPILRGAPPAEAGMEAEGLARADSLIREAIDDSLFTAAALAVGRRGTLVRLRGYGGEADEVDPRRTLFDIASLTKVVGTATAAALLVDRGVIDLDAPVRLYIPEWRGTDREEVTIRHLLTHTSGLPSGLWLYGSARSPTEAFRQAAAQPLVRPPGERVVYSDLGMIVLAEALERAAATPLDRLLAAAVFAPLGMQSTMYLPPLALRDRVIPTAQLTEREFVLRGIVHDANAFRLEGVAGHAGLFSTARDLAVFAQTMLNGGAYGSTRILSQGTVARFVERQPKTGTRALGWDTPADRSSAGRYFSVRSFGHTGYTGTSVWIDPEQELFVVLLTNRTFTGASSADMLRFRARVHDAVASSITDVPPPRRRGAR